MVPLSYPFPYGDTRTPNWSSYFTGGETEPLRGWVTSSVAPNSDGRAWTQDPNPSILTSPPVLSTPPQLSSTQTICFWFRMFFKAVQKSGIPNLPAAISRWKETSLKIVSHRYTAAENIQWIWILFGLYILKRTKHFFKHCLRSLKIPPVRWAEVKDTDAISKRNEGRTITWAP